MHQIFKKNEGMRILCNTKSTYLCCSAQRPTVNFSACSNSWQHHLRLP